MADARERIVFVTGKLAAESLTPVVHRLGEELSADVSIHVAKISVAALMTAEWLIGKLSLPEGTTRVILPGLCRGKMESLSRALGDVPVERGPDDLRDLPDYFHQTHEPSDPLSKYDIEILSEINHANRLPVDVLLAEAIRLRSAGADVIDLGGTPGERWTAIGDAVKRLKEAGLRVSIDSFDPWEVAKATNAGAELVLSVNSSNIDQAGKWGAEVVLLPDDHHAPDWLDNLAENSRRLTEMGVRHRLDPILDPIGFGFAASLHRYLKLREALPSASIMLGIGNLTELTEVDSAGVNAVMIGLCQEARIQSVLTTEVINWARTSTAEIDAARRLMYWAVTSARLPKHAGGKLVQLRDTKVRARGEEELRRLHKELRDPNFRLFAEEGKIYAMNGEVFEADADPFLLFERLGVEDPSHAFYLGWEMMKASLALLLGKEYTQDRALRWGLLTREEISHRDRRSPTSDGNES